MSLGYSCKSAEEKQFEKDKKLATEFIVKFYKNADIQELKFIGACKVKDSLDYLTREKEKNKKEKEKYNKKHILDYHDYYDSILTLQINQYEGQDTGRVLFNSYVAEFLYRDNSLTIQKQSMPIFITPAGRIGTADLSRKTMKIDWLNN